MPPYFFTQKSDKLKAIRFVFVFSLKIYLFAFVEDDYKIEHI